MSCSEFTSGFDDGCMPRPTTSLLNCCNGVDESLSGLVEKDSPPFSVLNTSTTLSATETELLNPIFLTLAFKSTVCEFPVHRDIFISALGLKERFIASFETLAATIKDDCASHTPAFLFASWLGFLSGKESGQNIELLRTSIQYFDVEFLNDNDIHVLLSRSPLSEESKQQMIKWYYSAKTAADDNGIIQSSSVLLEAARNGSAQLYAVFGGQGGTDHFNTLQSLYSTYPDFLVTFIELISKHLQLVSQTLEVRSILPEGINISKWLQGNEHLPIVECQFWAPISAPVIGLAQLAQYACACHILGVTPGQFRGYLKGVTGHSQGLVAAAAVAMSSSWPSFYENSKWAVTVLFWIGLRVQQNWSVPPSLGQNLTQDSVSSDERSTNFSPMLNVRNLEEPEIQHHLDIVNTHVEKRYRIFIALRNGPRNFVLVGPPKTLSGLNLHLEGIKASPDLDQTRVPFSQRKKVFYTRFLPVSAPFHSRYLGDAAEKVKLDLERLQLRLYGHDLGIPVFGTETGHDICVSTTGGDLLPSIVDMITTGQVNWTKATLFQGATHVLDFGPGGQTGIGAAISRNKQGSGVRVILAGVLDGRNSEDIGYSAELFDRQVNAPRFNKSWLEAHGPTLRTITRAATSTPPSGDVNSRSYIIDTKLSRLLSLPPIMVAGMTPTTAHWDIVAATMSAGYHIELACGGYYTADALRSAVLKIQQMAPRGRGIALNVIYASPQTLAWQIALIRQLRAEGTNIDGLTIGAGIPSLSVASEYIETLGLKYMSFKPGSAQGIMQVVEIAAAHEDFPIVLQWTGGRGGGHHSCEDFHQPILSTYARIRQQSNLVLVAGSGFGGWEDACPYLTGAWSVPLGFAAMPFDGVLFGSRMMVAAEAHTSMAAKEVIVEARGVAPEKWEDSYLPQDDDGGGGVISVVSEMGQPIHKLATRGVKFWAEMDRTVFSLPSEQRLPELIKRRDYIIRRLNADFQKVWFGEKDGQPADLHQMTLRDVARRLVHLLYVTSNASWVEPSYCALVNDWLRYIYDLSSGQQAGSSQILSVDDENPHLRVEAVLCQYPGVCEKLMSIRDIDHFLDLCREPGRKPVPFIPILDEHFEAYFKKDSLWQSEDIEAVPGQDVGRVCILHGPVAARYSTVINEPIVTILSNINDGLIRALEQDIPYYPNNIVPAITGSLYHNATQLGRDCVTPDSDGIATAQDTSDRVYGISLGSCGRLPSVHEWFRVLSDDDSTSWLSRILGCDLIVQTRGRIETNPLRRLLAPFPGLEVRVKRLGDGQLVLLARDNASSGHFLQLSRNIGKENAFSATIFRCHGPSSSNTSNALQLDFTYQQYSGLPTVVIEPAMDQNHNIKQFYKNIWLGDVPLDFDINMTLDGLLDATFHSPRRTLSAELIQRVCSTINLSARPFNIQSSSEGPEAPLDLAFIIGWESLVKPLFLDFLDVDYLKLVHLFNSFRVVGDRLQAGDEVDSVSHVTAIINQPSGKMVEVTCTVQKSGVPAVEIVTRFLFRGSYTDYENTFQRTQEAPMVLALSNPGDLAVLVSRKWIRLHGTESTELLGKELEFRVSTTARGGNNSDKLLHIQVTGAALLRQDGAESRPVLTISFKSAGQTTGNPVLSYLRRHGNLVNQKVNLEHSICLSGSGAVVSMPESNEVYAAVSGDFNPIHVEAAFARLAQLPGRVTHGMYVSSVVRDVVGNLCGGASPRAMHSYQVSFVGTVLPRAELIIHVEHIAMAQGKKVLKVEAKNNHTGERVLLGEAMVAQELSAYVFTGQGSQRVNMGMDLYTQSPVAAQVWDRADAYFLDIYGFKITDIVRHNPKELTIFFRGPRGRQIRENYMALELSAREEDGTESKRKVFKDIDRTTSLYTFHSSSGLINSTCFTQPAITLLSMALYEDMKVKGLIQEGSSFAGHSLGEYSALATMGQLMSVEELMAIVFFRGLAMRLTVGSKDDSDSESGHSDQGRRPEEYSMCAVNQSKIGRDFGVHDLKLLVAAISKESGWLLEIVNFNVRDLQYVCAGSLRALHCLSHVLEAMYLQRHSGTATLQQPCQGSTLFVSQMISASAALDLHAIKVPRTAVSTPLTGIDIPFHSSFLQPGVDAYRRFLRDKLHKRSVKPHLLIDRWIPNVTGEPFGISKGHFLVAFKLTNSVVLKKILDGWDS
ncbi:acyl transferase domain-containing protein [Xylariales sp. PMI_506]|nr:acyl transferase domain-containing protein [Xylariales sp. PMI_506]